ncbi:MAG TPA: MBL fold metallo-hydrolase, partial [Chloroflexi bacterium]|nr:MBL fold metallo-hydrolase [Chloroflexota bacterium]
LAAGVITLIVHRLLPRQATLLAAWLGIWGYVLLVGASAAVLRAGVMSSVMVLAQTARRRVHAPTSLAAAVVFLSALNPTVLWDVGFLLSVTATVGLLCYAPLLAHGLTRWLTSMISEARATRIVSLLNEALIVTIAVQLTTLGVLVGQFRTLTLVAPLTNLLILPVQPFVMLFGVGTVLGGLIWPPLALVPGWLSWAFLAYTTTVVTWTASFPWAAIDLHAVPTLFPIVYYGLLGGVTLWATHPREAYHYARVWLARLPRPVWAALVAGVALLVSYGASRPDGRLHVTFLDVSGGEAVLIQSPSGRQMLVDGGRDPRASLAALGSALPFWDRTLDAVVLTAPNQDRLAGLVEVLERYQVDLVVSGTSDPTGALATRWQSALEARDGLSQRRVSQGDVLPLDESVTVHVLWPPMGHPGPLVLQVREDKARLLIMSDATTVVEEALVATYGAALDTQVLLLPRYGAKTCCRPEFLQAVSPELAIVGPGRGSPLDSGVWARLMDVALYQVSSVGAVDVTWEDDILHMRTDTR